MTSEVLVVRTQTEAKSGVFDTGGEVVFVLRSQRAWLDYILPLGGKENL